MRIVIAIFIVGAFVASVHVAVAQLTTLGAGNAGGASSGGGGGACAAGFDFNADGCATPAITATTPWATLVP